jgi:spermidine synthase
MLKNRSIILYTLFFFSGFSALVFETVWQRQMVHVFGASGPASTAILTSFFLGIAFGSKLGGKLLNRVQSTMRVYACIEIWIAIWGLMVPALLGWIEPLYIKLFQVTDPGFALSLTYRYLMAIMVIMPATLGMGATLPFMNRLLTDLKGQVGKGVSLAYGINTIGSVLGTLFTGFVFLRFLGIQNSLFLAASINTLIAGIAYSMYKIVLIRPVPPPPELTEKQGELDGRMKVLGCKVSLYPWLVSIYFFCGFIALGYEITWIRLLSIFNTQSIITFTLVLAVYLLGFSSGSLILYPYLARKVSTTRIFCLSSLGVGVSALLLIPVFYRFPDVNWNFIVGDTPDIKFTLTTFKLITVESALTFTMIFLPTVFMGLAYPAVCAILITDQAETAQKSGAIYYYGTLGAMFGALSIGAFVIPVVGLVWTLAILGILSSILAYGSYLAIQEPSRPFRISMHSAMVIMVASFLLYGNLGHPFVSLGHLTKKGDRWVVSMKDVPRMEDIIRYKEGVTGTVMVKEIPDGSKSRLIYIDDQPVASTDLSSKVDAKMLAHLPLLLHENPKRMLSVGFGSGGTSWSMTLYDIEADTVEIEPEVINSAHLFHEQNYGVMDEPNFSVIINDARDYLHITSRKYDAIATDATNLQYKQNANLYTVEYFQLMKDSMTEGGIAVAWIPMIAPDEFKILLNSFATVYKDASLWYINSIITNFGILVGTNHPLRIDLDELKEKMLIPGIKEDLQEIGVNHPYQFIHFMHLDNAALRRYVGNAALHTDDRPILEFTSPLSFYQTAENFLLNMTETLEFRPKDYSEYVSILSPDDQEQFDRYGQASQLWNEFYASVYRYRAHKTNRRRTDAFNELVTMVHQGSEAKLLAPDYELNNAMHYQAEAALQQERNR